jgi:hypothetical protein
LFRWRYGQTVGLKACLTVQYYNSPLKSAEAATLFPPEDV